jgi:hypothetical protein
MRTVSINLRIPAELHAQLKQEADTDRRSLNAEILWLLAEALVAKESTP